MNTIILLTLGALLGAGPVWFVMRGRLRNVALEMHRLDKEIEYERDMLHTCEVEAEEAGADMGLLGEFNNRIHAMKEVRKQRIVERAGGQKLSSEDVAHMLDISKRTARRYLTELEHEGLIQQTARSGPSVRYVVVQ